jgi:hypothetical protein
MVAEAATTVAVPAIVHRHPLQAQGPVVEAGTAIPAAALARADRAAVATFIARAALVVADTTAKAVAAGSRSHQHQASSTVEGGRAFFWQLETRSSLLFL